MPNKKILLSLAVIVFSFFLGLNVFAEQINDFRVAIKINKDASINVSEKILYDFGAVEHHGIYRDIPIKYQRDNLNFNLKISQISVTDESGLPEKFSVSYVGKAVRIKIGDPDATITGAHYYYIYYTVRRAINYFSDHDELFWNTTGNAWTVDIAKASADVTLPAVLDKNKVSSACYYGAYGSQAVCSSTQSGAVLSFSSAGLSSGEGMSIVAGFPKGLVDEPTALGKIIFAIEDNWILATPLLLLIVLFFLWRAYGRSPQDKHPVVAQYDVPDKLTPAEVGTLIDTRADDKDLSAEIIYLAINGYLKIIRQEGLKIMGMDTGADYLLEKLHDSSTLDNDFDKLLLDSLVPDKERKLSQIKKDFSASGQFQSVKNSIYAGLKSKGYFARNPNTIRSIYAVAGIIFIGLAFYGFFSGALIVNDAASLASGILFLIFAPFMAQETLKGVETNNHLKGLKLYLGVVEKDRLDFHNAPEKNPETFEKFLPYAMVLGVEKAWAGQFAGIYKQPPAWYSYPLGYNFTVIGLTDDLRNFSNFSSSSLAASGHSGAGGGGFSGGGFGGGGGGSW